MITLALNLAAFLFVAYIGSIIGLLVLAALMDLWAAIRRG